MQINPNIMPSNIPKSGKPSQDANKTIRSLISGLSDDMAAVVGAGKRGNQKPITGAQSRANSPQQNQSQNKSVEDAQIMAAIAALIDDETTLKKDKKSKSFSEKLADFKVLREQLDGIKMDNPDEQAVVDEFMRNYDNISRQYKRLKQVSEKIDDLSEKKSDKSEK